MIRFALAALILLTASIFCDKSYSQNITLGNDYLQNYSLQDDEGTKPRPGFRKKRFGNHTLFLCSGYNMGYFKGWSHTFNWDILVQSSEKNALTLRVGVGLSTLKADSVFSTSGETVIPISANFLIGQTNHFEITLGGYFYENQVALNPFGGIGFRHQNPRGGFFYRATFEVQMVRVYDSRGTNISKSAAYGPTFGMGLTF